MALASVRNLVFAGHRVLRVNPTYQIFRRQCCPVPTVTGNGTIGDREVVGWGKNSTYMYLDHPGWPFPAIRFCEMTPDLLCLREKEKGDWRNLSLDEKKSLYRASFCQTYAEMLAPTGQWKSIVGFSLFWCALGIWWFLALRYMWSTEMPDTYTADKQEAQLKRLIQLEMNPIGGLASQWDYKNNRWK